jgi:NitT/TauT family transport system substrate-binding protein
MRVVASVTHGGEMNQERHKQAAFVRILVVLIAVSIALLPISSGGAERAVQPLEKIRIAYSSLSGNMAPLWITHEAGFFRKYGLDVELVFIAGGSTTARALRSRDVVLAQMAGAGVLQSRLQGTDLVLIGGLVNTLTFQFIVTKGITRPDQLKGKAVGITRYGSSTDFAARYALDKWELAPQTDVAISEFGTMPNLVAALETGKIAGAMLSAPFTLKAKKMGFPVLANLQMLGLEYQHTGIATTQALIKARPDLVRAVMRAYVEGIHYYKTHRKESLAILEKSLKTDDAEALSEIYEDIGLALVPEKPYPTVRGIQVMLRELAGSDPKAKSARPEDFVDLTFVKELDSSGFIDALYKAGPGLAKRRETVETPAATALTTQGASAPAVSPSRQPRADRQETAKRTPAPAKAAPSSPGPSVAREHTVVAGDSLSRIAFLYYGEGSEAKWMKIYEANRDTVRNPNYIYIGQKIVIPADARESL